MDKNREKKLALSFLNNLSAEDIKRIGETDISWESLEIFLGRERMELFENELSWADDNSIGEHGYVFIDEEEYPESLKQYADAPYRISYIGSRPKGCDGEYNLAKSITIVGTRTASSEGIKSAFTFARDSASASLVVYSGYADGIDKAAHYGCVAELGNTFAILASGLNTEYSHRRPKLEQEIIENGGGLLSPFPADTEPFKSNFYYRNKLLALISDATVVVEAPLHSGSLITAHAAAEGGKSVYVLTSGIKNSRTGEGCRRLKQEGAIEIDSYSMLSDKYIEFPKGTISIPIKKDKVAEMKTSGDAKRIVGYNGSYYAIVK